MAHDDVAREIFEMSKRIGLLTLALWAGCALAALLLLRLFLAGRFTPFKI